MSKKFANLWIRVFDSDGEFLLIEAAKVTPNWISPENDANRVWINDGKLRLVPLNKDAGENPSTKLSLQQSLKLIGDAPDRLVHSPLIEAEAFYRLEKYPGQISESLHHSPVTMPRKLAYLLHERPKAIAPATEAFYLRDPISLKPLLSASSSSPPSELLFPPQDLVTVSVRFTKVLYAQLKSQHFDPPPVWRTLLQDAEIEATKAAIAKEDGNKTTEEAAIQKQKTFDRLELGMKLTTGFEILVRDVNADKSDSRVAREVAILLEDLEDEEDDADVLPTDEEIRKWKDVDREDDDSWMDINFDDFEKELGGGGGGKSKPNNDDPTAAASFGDANTQADLRKIVSRFEAFLNDESAGIDGAQLDEMDVDDDSSLGSDDDDSEDDDEDKEVSFDEEQFARMMREMMGLPADGPVETGNDKYHQKQQQQQSQQKEKQKQTKFADVQDSDNDDDDEEDDPKAIQELMLQMEKELNSFGALSLDPTAAAAAKGKGKSRQQPSLPSTTTNNTKKAAEGSSSSSTTSQKATPPAKDQDGESEEEDDEIEIDYNLAKNLLESFKSQAGMAGPAGNLLGLMGMTLPRDEGEDEDGSDEEGHGGGPSRPKK